MDEWESAHRRRAPPAALHAYFSSLSDLSLMITTELSQIKDLIGSEAWDLLSEEERDRIIEDTFTIDSMKNIIYAQNSWGGMVNDIRNDVKKRAAFEEWKRGIQARKQELKKQKKSIIQKAGNFLLGRKKPKKEGFVPQQVANIENKIMGLQVTDEIGRTVSYTASYSQADDDDPTDSARKASDQVSISTLSSDVGTGIRRSASVNTRDPSIDDETGQSLQGSRKRVDVSQVLRLVETTLPTQIKTQGVFRSSFAQTADGPMRARTETGPTRGAIPDRLLSERPAETGSLAPHHPSVSSSGHRASVMSEMSAGSSATLSDEVSFGRSITTVVSGAPSQRASMANARDSVFMPESTTDDLDSDTELDTRPYRDSIADTADSDTGHLTLTARALGPAKGGLKLNNPSANNQSEVDGAQVVMRRHHLRNQAQTRKLDSIADRNSDDFGLLAEVAEGRTPTNSMIESDSPIISARQSPTNSPLSVARKPQSKDASIFAKERARQASQTYSDSFAIDEDSSTTDDMAAVNDALEQLKDQNQSPSLVRHRMSQLADAIQIPIAISSASTLNKPNSRQTSGNPPPASSPLRSVSGESASASSSAAVPATQQKHLKPPALTQAASASSASSSLTVPQQTTATTATKLSAASQPSTLTPSSPPTTRAFDSAAAAQASMIITPSTSSQTARQPVSQTAPAAPTPTTPAASAARPAAPVNRLQGVKTLTIAERRQQQLKQQQQAQGPANSATAQPAQPTQPAQPAAAASKAPPAARTAKPVESSSLLDEIASSFGDTETDDLDSLRAISLSNAEPGSRQGRLSVSQSLRRHGNATLSTAANDSESTL
eukprot:m.475257 g.475257  ORF g.475257 m.475257 type:complete len:836 (-) comp57140_c0_seq41:189-2696(-)